jgi:hypothetical protein
MTGSMLLPLQLLNFDGKALQNSVQLNCTVSHEVNVDYHEIERSSNQSVFASIVKVDAQDISSGQNTNYTFNDL